VLSFAGYLRAHENRRAFFREYGATSTDHGHVRATTAWLEKAEIEALYAKALAGTCTPAEADVFRGHMLVEMARMSLDDGMVLQIHPGVHRGHNPAVLDRFGPNMGADIRSRPSMSPRSSRCSTATATIRACRSSCSRSTRTAIAASSPRSPGTIRRSSSARRGGSTTAPRACAGSASG
jgi:hypothetical protein